MENPDWLVKVRVCRTSQVACPRTVIYLTKLYKKPLAILLYTCGAVERQQRQQGVGLAAGKAAKVEDWLQAGAVKYR